MPPPHLLFAHRAWVNGMVVGLPGPGYVALYEPAGNRIPHGKLAKKAATPLKQHGKELGERDAQQKRRQHANEGNIQIPQQIDTRGHGDHPGASGKIPHCHRVQKRGKEPRQQIDAKINHKLRDTDQGQHSPMGHGKADKGKKVEHCFCDQGGMIGGKPLVKGAKKAVTTACSHNDQVDKNANVHRSVSEAPLKTGVHLGGDPLCPVVEIESFPNGRAEDQGEDHSGQLLIIYD